MAVAGLISLSANNAFSQQVKKKIVRVIEVDDKGEKVVKEYNLSNDAAKFDSITHDVRKKIQVEQIKMDSLERILMKNLPNNSEFILIPPVPPMHDMSDFPDFNYGFDMPEAPFFGSDDNFEMFNQDSTGNSAKIYYSEKSFDKSGDLDKILEDLESGKFDPQKWNMKEVEKDKIKDFKTKGKGEVIVFEHRTIVPPHIRHFYGNPHRIERYRRDRDEAREDGNEHRMIYINGDSLNMKDFETYTIESTVGSDGEGCEKIVVMSPDDSGHKRIKGHRMVVYSTDSIDDKGKMKTFTIKSTDDSDEPNGEKTIVVTTDGNKSNVSFKDNDEGNKEKKMIVIVNDNKTTKFEFTKPSADDFKMLEKSELMKEDKAKLLSDESLMLIPKKEKDKYSINFQEKETGKVKVIIADDKGKAIKTVDFDYTKGKTEKEVEIKDLKSGVYFIQAQLNGKTTTSKLEIKIDL